MHIPTSIYSKVTNASALNLSVLYFPLAIVLTFVFWFNKSGGYTFGYEYGNVAAALVAGKGFSDLFGTSSGPTAWCPPFYVLIHAIIFFLFGIKTLTSFWVLLIVRVLMLTYCLFLLVKINYSEKLNEFRFLLLPVFIALSAPILMKEFDDKSLNVLASILVVFLFSKIYENGVGRYLILLFIVAFALPLSNLFLTIGVVLLLLSDIVSKWFLNRSLLSIKISGLLLAIIMTSTLFWGLRNQIMLGKFIPSKSNLWFEVYIANVVDEDGIPKQSNWYRYHPMANSSVRAFYSKMGELRFLQEYEEKTKEYLTKRTDDFIKKIFNRFLHASILVTSSKDVEQILPTKIRSEDLLLLESHGYTNKSVWLNFNMSEAEFMSRLDLLHLEDTEEILKEWSMKKKKLAEQSRKKVPDLIIGVMVTILPTICLIVCLLISQVRNSIVFKITFFFLFLSLSPYILISHYARYQFFQIGFFSIIIFLCLSTLASQYLTKYNTS